MAPAFTPKQAITKDVDLYSQITANSTKDVARAILHLIPEIQAHARIHDNGCGAGEVTSEILALKSSHDVQIEATDIDQSYLDRFRSRAEENHWPVTITNMAAENLTFADHSFDLSIANFVIFITPGDGIPAVKHMHRTLKPGCLAVFTAWARLPHFEPVKKAHIATRGENGSAIREIPLRWWVGSHLESVAVQAGFTRENMRLETATVYIHITDKKHLAHVLWSYLGVPVVGWSEEDEERWEDAIEVIMEGFENGAGFEHLPNGEMRIELVANVLIARK